MESVEAPNSRALAGRLQQRNYQRTLPLDPGGPGANPSSPDIFSPGTVAVDREFDPLSVVSSPEEAQADNKHAISKTRTPDLATRLAISDEPNH